MTPPRAAVRALLASAGLIVPSLAVAQGEPAVRDIVPHWSSWLAVALFGAGYLLVVLEERTHLRKSIPMITAAGVLWVLVALSPAAERGNEILHQNVLEFAELFLFILAAVSFV